MKLRNKAVPTVYVLLVKDNEILVARRYNTGYQDGNYQVPAGHVEEGELPTEALIREAKEEIGIDLTLEDIELVHVSYRPKHDETGDRVDFFFKVKKWSGEIINAEPHKCDDVKWVKIDELPENMTLHIKMGIEAMRDKLFYREINLDLLKAHNLFVEL